MAERYPRTAEGTGKADSRPGEGEEDGRYMTFTLSWYASSKQTSYNSLVTQLCWAVDFTESDEESAGEGLLMSKLWSLTCGTQLIS